MMGWQWHQLNHMQAICTSLQKMTTPAPHQSDFYGPAALPDTQPTVSKHWRTLSSKENHVTIKTDLYSTIRSKLQRCVSDEDSFFPPRKEIDMSIGPRGHSYLLSLGNSITIHQSFVPHRLFKNVLLRVVNLLFCDIMWLMLICLTVLSYFYLFIYT